MSSKKTFIFIAFTAAVLMAFGFQNSSEHKVLFEKAKFTMETKGDLKGAIKLFEEIIQKYPDQRDYAAKSQLYIGFCYEKLGLKEAKQAQKAFQKVVANYPGQVEAVRLAKEKLSFILKAQTGADRNDKQFRMRKLWENLDVRMNNLSSVSPDGRYIAFTDRHGGDIAVLDLFTKKRTRFTDNFSIFGDVEKLSATERMSLIKKMKYASGSIWAPDGQKIAYGWSSLGIPGEGGCDLCIIPLTNPEPRVLLHSEEFPFLYPLDWTSDGNHILAAFLKRDMTGQFALVKVADGSIRMIKQLERPLNPLDSALLLPDEKHIVYDLHQEKDSSERDIFLYSLEEGKDIKLVEHPANDFILDLSPNGKKLFFASNRRGSLDSWIVGIEGGHLQGDPLLVQKELGGINPLGFDKSGSFYYVKDNWTSNIYTATYDRQKAKLKTSPEKATQKYEGSNLYPAWSPDGKSLAYMSSRLFGSEYVWFLCIKSEGADGQKEFRLELNDVEPIKWSPDGESILVVGESSFSHPGIYEIDALTGESKELKTFDPDFHWVSWASWSPDKRKLYYTIQKHDESLEKLPFTLKVYDIESGQEQELKSGCFHMSLSPDGDWLSFERRNLETLLNSLYVMPSSGGESRKILTLGEKETFLTSTWAADGKGLVFAKYKDDVNKCSLWQISLDEEKPQKLGLEMKRLNYLSLHPDGQRMAFCSSTLSVDIWVMENFLPGTKTRKESKSRQ